MMDTSSISILDWIFLSIIAMSSLLGLMRGAATTIIALVTLFISSVFSYNYGPEASHLINSKTHIINQVGGYLIVFIGCMLTGMIIALIVRKILHVLGLTILDKVFGLTIGAVRGYVFSLLIYLGMTSAAIFDLDVSFARQSMFSKSFDATISWTRSEIPILSLDSIRDDIEDAANDLRKY